MLEEVSVRVPTVCVTVLISVSFLSGAWAAKKDTDPLGLVYVPSRCATPTSAFGTTDLFGLVAAPSYGANSDVNFGDEKQPRS